MRAVAMRSPRTVWLKWNSLRERIRELECELAAFRHRERLIGDTLVSAQHAADEMRADALADVRREQAEAERELRELRVQIERYRTLEREVRSRLHASLDEMLEEIDEQPWRASPLLLPIGIAAPLAIALVYVVGQLVTGDERSGLTLGVALGLLLLSSVFLSGSLLPPSIVARSPLAPAALARYRQPLTLAAIGILAPVIVFALLNALT
jgi:hypothetical protein